MVMNSPSKKRQPASLKSRFIAVILGLCVACASVPAQAQTATNPTLRPPSSSAPQPRLAPTAPTGAVPATTAPSDSRTLQQTGVPGFQPTASTIPAPTVVAPPVVDSQVVETTLIADVPVFGQILFQGAYAATTTQAFNPDYQIAYEDILDIRIWGAYETEARVSVDSQGNVFIPTVGPVKVANVRNADLNTVVEGAVKRKFRENVSVYASLAATQPVKVFVSGFVVRPGLYGASSQDSILRFLDLAGGISPTAGSYIGIRVLRRGAEIATINLYEFLLSGKLPLLQFRDGDSIFVGPLNSTAKVMGLVATPARYEFEGSVPLKTLLTMAGTNATATHVHIIHNSGNSRRAEYLSLTDDLSAVSIQPGDELEVVADRKIGEIVVLVEGEHLGRAQYVLPYAANLADLLQKMQFSPQSLRDGLQLYRLSIAARQKQVLDESLDKLEASVYAARSTTVDEAQLRTTEAALVGQFIARARLIEPKGQLILGAAADPTRIALEDGDVIRIPRENAIIAVQGEVFFPNSFVHDPSLDIADYIARAGGLSQKGDVNKIIVRRPDGEVQIASLSFWGDTPKLGNGDEILVLPKVDTKTFQFSKDIVEILYQTAIVASVALAL